MKRLISAFVVIIGCAAAASQAQPAPLTSLHAIHMLSHAEAAKNPPAAFEATVNYRRIHETALFVQDGGDGIYVNASVTFNPVPGDRIFIKGQVHDSFRPIVVADSIVVLHHGALPKAVPATFDDLIHSLRDCQRVSVRAHVQSADLGLSADENDIHLVLTVDGGTINAYINSADPKVLSQLLDAEVEISGVAQARFDGKMQQTGISLTIPSLDDLKIIKRATTSPWSLPVTQMDEIFTNYHVQNLSRRVHVQGTITYYQPGSAIVLQSGSKSLWVMTVHEKPLQIGSLADATGFPDIHDNFLSLSDGEVKQNPVLAPVTPQAVTRSQLTSSRYIFDLVSIEGQVVMEVREEAQDEYVLVSDGQVFSAIYRHPDVANLHPLPMKEIPLGSKVRVAGICIVGDSNPWNRDVSFNILMRTPSDIAVIAGPPMLNIRSMILLAGLLLVLFLFVGIRGWIFERKVRRQTAIQAAIEQRRSRILEDINGSSSLAEILEKTTEMISFILNGAPCWCEVTDGARLGESPDAAKGMRLVYEEIPGRAGPPLGRLYAAFDPKTPPCAAENEALVVGTRLATLAIETRRLYSDLLHRSEFDLLTDIHNRFSLEKRLDALIDIARQNAGIFGLIYIDLDGFKQVNDFYGHQIGDLFLQVVAQRMKNQLRPHDTFARLGGDEFAVLLPTVRNRAGVEEIAQRLEHCFDEPLILEENTVRGAASFGVALYPEDSATRDGILNVADAAMYAAKNAKRILR
jgi:diguanylate cyclase (GGDEF)-like protein